MSDLISRQMAIEVLRNRWLKTRNYEGIGEDIAEECEIYLKTLPSAQPVRHGHWIDEGLYNDDFPYHAWKCSECGEYMIEIDVPWYKFCPECGAKMDGGEE